MGKRKERQMTIRISATADQWLERMAGSKRSKATVVRDLIEREMQLVREEELLATFNRAARDLTSADRKERDLLLGAFSGARNER